MTARDEAVANKVLELIESARKWGWRQAGGGLGDKEMEEQTKLRASELAALLTTRQEVAPVAWMPIDSAPRDGSWIVLVNANNGESATAKSAGPEFKTLPDYEWIQWPYINGQPTHWMHCPKESN